MGNKLGPSMNEMDLAEYRRLITSVPDQTLIIEIGCFKGRPLALMADLIRKKELELWVVDVFDTGEDEFRANLKSFFRGMLLEFKRTMEKAKLHPLIICGTCYDVANILLRIPYEKPSLVFIDANHGYEWVKQDINTMWKFIMPGGIIAGRDYWEYEPGVMKAVDEIFGKRPEFPALPSCIWSVKKETL